MTSADLLLYGAAVCLFIGAIFAIAAVLGFLKFNDPMTRLHAPTKIGTVGIGMILLASMLNSLAVGEGSFHEILIMAFLFVTAPISANFIAKVNIHRVKGADLPAPQRDETWATLDSPDRTQL